MLLMMEGIGISIPIGLAQVGPWGLVILLVALNFIALIKRKIVPEPMLIEEQQRTQRALDQADKAVDQRDEALALAADLTKQNGDLIDALNSQTEERSLVIAGVEAMRELAAKRRWRQEDAHHEGS